MIFILFSFEIFPDVRNYSYLDLILNLDLNLNFGGLTGNEDFFPFRPTILNVYGGPEVQTVKNMFMGRMGFGKFQQLGTCKIHFWQISAIR